MQPSLLRYSPSRIACKNIRSAGDRDGGATSIDSTRARRTGGGGQSATGVSSSSSSSGGGVPSSAQGPQSISTTNNNTNIGGTGGPLLSNTEDIINSILPPREWSEGGEVWAQTVSTNPATRGDVISLQEELDKRLKRNKARNYGICPIREELYSQCFDELLRQVTIQCAERGLLLNRVRGELRQLIKYHRRLYESSAAFGVRKMLLYEADKEARHNACKELTAANADLQQQIEAAKQQLAEVAKEHERKVAAEAKEHEANVAALRRKAAKVKREIERLLSSIQQT